MYRYIYLQQQEANREKKCDQRADLGVTVASRADEEDVAGEGQPAQVIYNRTEKKKICAV